MMIPLRRALIVQQHGILKYPEGTACAEVLKAGASDESRALASDSARAEWERSGAGAESANTGAKTIFAGFGIGFVYTTLMKAFFTWKEYPTKVFGDPFNKASVSVESSPALLGVGYIIGPKIASIMAAGGVLAYLVLIPMISFFGQYLGEHNRPAGDDAHRRDGSRTTSATPTSSTSARARSPRAASSASSGRCRPSGTA